MEEKPGRATLTVRDLLLPGEPLDPAEVLAGEEGLSKGVTWVVSLRPYPPAFPRLRGGELALVAVEHILRLDPPATLAGVVEHLASRDAAGVVVRGEVDAHAREAATAAGLPLIRLAEDALLPDIEQAIMRECALYQARQEVVPQGNGNPWWQAAIEGRLAQDQAALSEAKRRGYDPSTRVVIALLIGGEEGGRVPPQLEAAFHHRGSTSAARPAVGRYLGSTIVLVPSDQQAGVEKKVASLGLACGLSTPMPLVEAPDTLAQAELALAGSLHLYGCKPTRFADLGADRVLLLLYRNQKPELEAYVESILGPMLRHDVRASSPLLPTVRAFVSNGGRLRETAAQIYVHRNTLAYRLDRASEILGLDLKEPGARLAVELAIRALPLVAPHAG